MTTGDVLWGPLPALEALSYHVHFFQAGKGIHTVCGAPGPLPATGRDRVRHTSIPQMGRRLGETNLHCASPQPSDQLHVLGHDGHSLGVNGHRLGILHQLHNIRLGGLHQGHHCL